MQQKYYVSHEGRQQGPYTIVEIVGLVGSSELSPLDYIYDEGKADWIVFMEHDGLSSQIKNLKPKAPPVLAERAEPVLGKKIELNSNSKWPAQVANHMQHEWYVLKGENKFGPFAYIDVVKMLQQGVVYEFDFVWHKEMSAWQRVAEVPAFHREQLQMLKSSSMPELSEVFFRRRYRRVKYGATILVHDNKKVWKGQGVEISEGGAGVIMDNATILPGQELYLHFKPGDGVPPFNAICEVVAKKYVSGIANPNEPIQYGLKFKSLSAQGQEALKLYTSKKAA